MARPTLAPSPAQADLAPSRERRVDTSLKQLPVVGLRWKPVGQDATTGDGGGGDGGRDGGGDRTGTVVYAGRQLAARQSVFSMISNVEVNFKYIIVLLAIFCGLNLKWRAPLLRAERR